MSRGRGIRWIGTCSRVWNARDWHPHRKPIARRTYGGVTFDITGLGPSIEEIDAFVGDVAEGAHGRLVDRLLASERYGERMAVEWLDLARYADTYGYQSDVAREVWAYRDWVIGAFNQNLSYDKFVTWQLAGDLLSGATREQRLATCFNRLHRQTNEGGSIEEEYRVEYVSDRAQTFATSMLGLTLECARCHEHKFDPISQTEYYALSAFFGSIDESGLYSHFTNPTPTPALMLPTPEQEQNLKRLHAAVDVAEMALMSARSSQVEAFELWLQSGTHEPAVGGLVGHYTFDSIEDGKVANLVNPESPATVFDEPGFVEGHDGNAVALSGDNGVRFNSVGAFTRSDPFTISMRIRVPRHMDRAVVFHRSRSWTDAGEPGVSASDRGWAIELVSDPLLARQRDQSSGDRCGRDRRVDARRLDLRRIEPGERAGDLCRWAGDRGRGGAGQADEVDHRGRARRANARAAVQRSRFQGWARR